MLTAMITPKKTKTTASICQPVNWRSGRTAARRSVRVVMAFAVPFVLVVVLVRSEELRCFDSRSRVALVRDPEAKMPRAVLDRVARLADENLDLVQTVSIDRDIKRLCAIRFVRPGEPH